MTQYDAYIFDLYGTLVHIRTDEQSPAFWQAVSDLFAAHGAGYDAASARAAYRSLCDRQTAAHPDPCFELNIADVFAAMYREKGVEPDEGLIAETAVAFRRASTLRGRPYHGAAKLLETLRRNARVILLTNAQRLFTEPELRQYDLWDAFDAIYISSDCGIKKPSPDFFALPLRDFSLDPSRCLMIGNDPIADVAGAQAVGMDTFFIRTGISPKSPDGPEATYSIGKQNLARVTRLLTGKVRRPRP